MRKRSDPNRATWSEQLETIKADVAKLDADEEREIASGRAQRLEAAIHMEEHLRPKVPKPST